MRAPFATTVSNGTRSTLKEVIVTQDEPPRGIVDDASNDALIQAAADHAARNGREHSRDMDTLCVD